MIRIMDVKLYIQAYYIQSYKTTKALLLSKDYTTTVQKNCSYKRALLYLLVSEIFST